MRLEKSEYDEELPIDIKIADIVKYPPHYHKDLEILFVLDGTLNFRNGPFDYVLKAGDVFTNNRCEVHSMYSDGKPNKVAIIKISGSFFTRYFPNFSKSTYMFYSDKENVPQQERLKGMLLSLLDKYFKQGHSYKADCIDATFKIIQYLNNNFNVFAFGNKQLRKFEETNPINIKRLHDIIHYTYDNHNANITLEDLAELIHLSPYYISHLVKKTVGISFNQFLYFVRVEWSEVNLLNANKKISVIAKDVGFSSTAYYRMYFEKWFGCSPEKYRQKYIPMIKSAKNREILRPYTQMEILETLDDLISSSDMYDTPISKIEYHRERHYISMDQRPIAAIGHTLQIVVTLDDYNVLQNELISRLQDLGCKKILLYCHPDDNAVESIMLHETLQKNGFHVSLSNSYDSPAKSFGFDSIASAFYILDKGLFCDTNIVTIPFRDQGNITVPLKGTFSLASSRGTLKPSYYVTKMLSLLQGQILMHSNYCTVVRSSSDAMTYMVLTYNYNDKIEQLCSSSYTPYEIKAIIDSYNDELEVETKIGLPQGKYFVVKYSIDEYNTAFNFFSKQNFPTDFPISIKLPLTYYSAPNINAETIKIKDLVHVNDHFRGVGISLTVIQRL